MINRRTMITGTALGGVLSALAPTAAGAESPAIPQGSERSMESVARAVEAVRDEIAHQNTFWEIAPVREPIRTYLRANGKFPDFIDVGADVWQQVYDWLVRFEQPATIGRTVDGRYVLVLMATTVVLRPELAPAYIGVPYDNR